MLTIFAVPKPFVGHIGTIQRNAVRSWLALDPTPQVLLAGDEEGLDEAAAELGVGRIAGVARSDLGTPLLDGIFASVEQAAVHGLVCYTNADILLSQDLVDAAAGVAARWPRFLVVGRVWDADVRDELDLPTAAWRGELRRRIESGGAAREDWALDYFLFPKGALGALPPFAVGRPAWDNWMIYRARSLRLPVVDASEVVAAVHQLHDYGHVPQATGSKWQGPEAERNRDLLGARERESFSLRDATHRLVPGGIERVDPGLERRLRVLGLLHPALMPLYRGARGLQRALRR